MENNDIKTIWQDVLRSSKEFLPDGITNRWLLSCMPVSLDGGILVLDVPNPFAKENIEKNILKYLESFLRDKSYAESVLIQINETHTQSADESRRAEQIVMTQNPQRKN